MNLERLAGIAVEWGLNSGPLFSLSSRTLGFSEHLLHDLSHAAVFDISFGRRASRRVTARFNHYARSKSYFTSDLAECRALAVEKLALEQLHWQWVPWHEVIGEAASAMWLPRFNREGVTQCTERLMLDDVNHRRADKVVTWLNVKGRVR